MKPRIHALFMLMILLSAVSTIAKAESLTLQLNLSPVSQQITNDTILQLSVSDRRPSSIPGLTVDGNALRIANDLTQLIRHAASTALQQKGYVIAANDPSVQRKLHIELSALSYQAEKKLFRSQIHVEVVLRAIVTQGRHTLNKSFHGKNAYEVAFSPSTAENSRMLSETIAHALDSMLHDEEIDQALR